jgi:4-hydroxy-tetrahydrodipicolinate synthase
MKLPGLIPPMITPLKDGGDVDGTAVEALIEHLIDGGVSGVFIMGSSGEGPWLSSDQRRQLLDHTVRAVDRRIPVLAGALEPGTGGTLEMIQLIADHGGDVAVIAAPYYFPADAAVQLQHIRTVVEQSPLPVVLYNIPPMTHNPILAETVAQCAALDNLLGIKDSAGDWANFEALIALKAQHENFQVWQGAEKQAAQSALAGADGLVCGLANLVPEKFVAILAQANSGNSDEALRIQAEIDALWELHAQGFWLACLKHAASIMGFGDGSLSIPAQPLPDSAKAAVAAVVGALEQLRGGLLAPMHQGVYAAPRGRRDDNFMPVGRLRDFYEYKEEC